MYATVAFGASLALAPIASAPGLSPELARGLQSAEGITGDIQNHLSGEISTLSDKVRADFFLKNVPFGSIIYNAARQHNVSPELVAAVARAESAFHPMARSHQGAIGVMQLVPRTGRWLGATDLNDPTQNIVAGAKYLQYLSERFGGNEDHIIASYNAGEGNVRRFGGVPPFKETQDYVARVHRFQRDLRSRLEGQLANAGIGWSMPASDLPSVETTRQKLRPKIDIHWTTRQERRAQKERS